jgi:NTE family protein
VRTHNLQRIVRTLYDKLPAKLKSQAGEDVLAALGCDTVMHIMRLEYGGHDWHMAAKDINFSKGSIAWRWEQGYRDANRSIQEAGWLAAVTDQSGIVVHELAPRPVQ